MHSLPIESQYNKPQDFHHTTFFMESTQFYLWISLKRPTLYLDLIPTCQQQISSLYISNSCQSYLMTSPKLQTNSYNPDYRTRQHSNDVTNEDSGIVNTNLENLYSYGIQELRKSWIGRQNHTTLDHWK